MKGKVGFQISQIFTFVEFSCVNFIDQIFIIGLFQLETGKHGPHPEKIRAWHSLKSLTSSLFLVFWVSSSQFYGQEQPPHALHFDYVARSQFWPKLDWPCAMNWKNCIPLTQPNQIQLGGQLDS